MKEKLLEQINLMLNNKNKPVLKELNGSFHLRNDLGFDSLDLAELTVRIENLFGIDIFENGIVNTIDEVIQVLNSNNEK